MKPIYTPQFNYDNEEPFYIEFKWQNVKSRITFEKGEDLIKLSMLLSTLLTSNDIPNKLDITSNNQ